MEEIQNLRKINEKVEELLIEGERINENMKIITSYLSENEKTFNNYIEEQKLMLASSKANQIELIRNKNDLNNLSDKLKLDSKKIFISIEKNFNSYKNQIENLEKTELKIDLSSIEKNLNKKIDNYFQTKKNEVSQLEELIKISNKNISYKNKKDVIQIAILIFLLFNSIFLTFNTVNT